MLEVKLTAALKQLCPRTFPDFAPADTQRPYVTYQQIGGEAPSFVDDTVPTLENAQVQVNVWANTRLEAKSLIKQIEAALTVEAGFQARPVSASASDFDAHVPVYCSRQDFSIWADR